MNEKQIQLARQEALYNSAEATFVIDSKLKVVMINLAAGNFFKLDEDKVIGQDIRKIVKKHMQRLFTFPDDFSDFLLKLYERNTFSDQHECSISLGNNTEERWLEYTSKPIQSGDLSGGRIEYYHDITKRKRTEYELKKSTSELRGLSDHLESVRENERKRISRELHDDLGQSMTVLKTGLSYLKKKIPKDMASLVESARYLSKYIDVIIQKIQKLTTDLRPGLLDNLGLMPALEWQVKEFQKQTGIKCELNLGIKEDVNLDKDLSTTIFRIVQEALTNVVRHADASKININLEEKEGKLMMTIEDNGKGITQKEISHPKSFGIMGMRERVQSWNGEYNIDGDKGSGTTISVRLPSIKKKKYTN
ncbi:ATP-binding protein [Acidobacteriota bacterium]